MNRLLRLLVLLPLGHPCAALACLQQEAPPSVEYRFDSIEALQHWRGPLEFPRNGSLTLLLPEHPKTHWDIKNRLGKRLGSSSAIGHDFYWVYATETRGQQQYLRFVFSLIPEEQQLAAEPPARTYTFTYTRGKRVVPVKLRFQPEPARYIAKPREEDPPRILGPEHAQGPISVNQMQRVRIELPAEPGRWQITRPGLQATTRPRQNEAGETVFDFVAGSTLPDTIELELIAPEASRPVRTLKFDFVVYPQPKC